MSLLDFVKEEELGDFMNGVVSQMHMDEITEKNIVDASRQLAAFKDAYDEIENKYGNSIAGNYAATYIAILLLVMSSNDIGEISVVPNVGG